MKLKYYLRGLGIGMLVAALVLVLSGNTATKMSDEDVKRRAAQLGMVEKDKTVLEDIEQKAPEGSETPAISEAPEGSGASEDPESGATAQEPQENEEAALESEENEAAPEAETDADTEANAGADTEAQAPADEIEQKADEVAERAEEVAENAVTGRTVVLEVRRGDSSVSVARRAEEAGLVRSAADFDVFLCQNGYDKRISIGSYEIPEGASEKEIADAITKSR